MTFRQGVLGVGFFSASVYGLWHSLTSSKSNQAGLQFCNKLLFESGTAANPKSLYIKSIDAFIDSKEHIAAIDRCISILQASLANSEKIEIALKLSYCALAASSLFLGYVIYEGCLSESTAVQSVKNTLKVLFRRRHRREPPRVSYGVETSLQLAQAAQGPLLPASTKSLEEIVQDQQGKISRQVASKGRKGK